MLDVACGTGIVARQAAPLVGPDGRVAALDVNPAMLAVARAVPAPSGAVIDWHDASAMALPFPDGVFDVVLCQHGLQFFPDRTSAVREMHRVLAANGRAVAIVLQSLEQHPVFDALMQSVARQLSLPIAAVMTPFALSDAAALQALFATAGFSTVEVLAESSVVRFPEPERFVPLSVTSSAAAIPAFAQLEALAQATLMDIVRKEVEPVIRSYREADVITFSMHAHVAVATR